jgi:hypothetical protein
MLHYIDKGKLVSSLQVKIAATKGFSDKITTEISNK